MYPLSLSVFTIIRIRGKITIPTAPQSFKPRYEKRRVAAGFTPNPTLTSFGSKTLWTAVTII
jgi:hypothetical protein